MKKQLLTGALLLGALFTASAQNSCADALTLPIGTTTVGTPDGEYIQNCFEAWGTDDTADAAEWYKVTATADGAFRVNTNLEANTGGDADTRISVYSGTCDALVCWISSDDVYYGSQTDVNNNYLTDFQFPVLEGETYYIVLDNQWSDESYQVELSFAEPGCSSNSLTENWSNAASYYFCWQNIDNNDDDNGWSYETRYNWNTTYDSDPVAIIFSPEADANDDYLISNAKNLVAGTTYTVNVKYNGVNLTTADANESFEVIVFTEDEDSLLAPLETIGTVDGITMSGTALNQLEGSATTGSFTFTPDTAGEYFFGVHATSEAGGGALIVFEVNITGTMGVATPSVADFAVSPNPANTVVTIANADNALVNAVSVADMNGRVVKTAAFDGVAQAQVNVSDLANGVYMMTISSDKGSVTKKIVKN